LVFYYAQEDAQLNVTHDVRSARGSRHRGRSYQGTGAKTLASNVPREVMNSIRTYQKSWWWLHETLRPATKG